MLRQGTPAPEFESAEAMQAHYRGLQERLWTPPARRLEAKAETARSIAVAQNERRLREEELEARERNEAALAEQARLDELVHQVLSPEQIARSPKRVITRVAAAFGLTYADIVGERRSQDVVRARYAAIAAVREARPEISLPQLGRCFGNRDHTTILHAIRKMERTGVPQPPAGKSFGERVSTEEVARG